MRFVLAAALLALACGRTELVADRDRGAVPGDSAGARARDPALSPPCATSCCARHFTTELVAHAFAASELELGGPAPVLAYASLGNELRLARRGSGGWADEALLDAGVFRAARLELHDPALIGLGDGGVQVVATTTGPPRPPYASLSEGPLAFAPSAEPELKATGVSMVRTGRGLLLAAAQYREGPLVLAERDGERWTTEPLPWDLVLWTRLTLDAQSQPVVALWQRTSDPLDDSNVTGRLVLLQREAAGWRADTLREGGLVWFSPVAGADGGIQVFSSPAGTGGPIRQHRLEGGAWEQGDVIAGLNHLQQARLDTRGQPHLVYFRVTSAGPALLYACHDGERWIEQVVDEGFRPAWGGATLVLDELDRPHLTWTTGAGELFYAR